MNSVEERIRGLMKARGTLSSPTYTYEYRRDTAYKGKPIQPEEMGEMERQMKKINIFSHVVSGPILNRKDWSNYLDEDDKEPLS